MKKTILIFTCAYFLSFALKAQIGGNSLYNGSQQGNEYGFNTLGGVNLNLDPVNSYNFQNLLEANVMANVKASSFVAIFAISQQATTIESADLMMNSRIDLLRNLLSEEHIQADQVFTDPVSLVPTYEVEVENKKYSRTYNEVPSGFEMKKNVHITFRSHEQINRIISLAARAEIYDLVKADYVIDDLDKILENLRKEALEILIKKKEAILKLGLTARFTQVGEKYGSAYPLERYQQYYAFKTGTPQHYATQYKKSTIRQVNYNYAEKNKTIYYEKVSDKQFDKIINPVVGEPMVQVYLSLKAPFQVYDPKDEADVKAYNLRVRDIGEKEMQLRLIEKQKQIEQIGKKPVKP
jgi:hypothetical protein